MSSTPEWPVVVEMPRTSVTPDGSLVEMEFKNSDGQLQLLRFAPDAMLVWVNRAFQLFVNHRLQAAAQAGHIQAQPMAASTTHAQSAIGGKAVVVGVRLQSGLPVEFSISPDEAEELHRQLGKAVKKARQQLSSGRH